MTGNANERIRTASIRQLVAKSLLDDLAVASILVSYHDEACIGGTPAAHALFKTFLQVVFAFKHYEPWKYFWRQQLM